MGPPDDDAPECMLCGHEAGTHTDDAGCTQRNPLGWQCPCYLRPAYAADLTTPHTIKMLRPWNGAEYRASWWPTCPCGWDGLSYGGQKSAKAHGVQHLDDMRNIVALHSAPTHREER